MYSEQHYSHCIIVLAELDKLHAELKARSFNADALAEVKREIANMTTALYYAEIEIAKESIETIQEGKLK